LPSSTPASSTAPQAILFRVLDIADRAYVLDQGGVVYHAAARGLPAGNDIEERYCSV
jgi:ABC-type branched-subunit amino acid transport system ATPase component